MKIVLSIKPEFAEKIFNGTKKFEFRKSIFKQTNIKSVLVYASSPVQMVIGEFEIEQIIKSDLETLWSLTKQDAGISKEFFLEYFSDKMDGYAIQVKAAKRFKKPRNLKEHYNLVPPQSFAYLR